MSVQGRQDFEQWYDDQVARGVEFDFQQELLAYCKSDIKLLKQGCLTFKRDFKALAHFNPFDQMTIALACNRDLRTNRIEANIIASEPLQGLKSKHQPLPRGHAVVEVSGSQVRPTAPACTEPGRVPHLGHPLHRQRLRCHHAHRLRVSRVLLARLSPLSCPTPKNPRQVIGPDHGGCLSHHPGQSPVSERPRVHGGGDVGMRLAPATQGPAPGGRLRGVPAPPAPSAASRGVLWRTHRRGAIASHRRPRGRDPLLRLHQSLPLGEQERPLPCWAHGINLRPRHRGLPSVLCFGQMYRAASHWLVPSRPALSQRG